MILTSFLKYLCKITKEINIHSEIKNGDPMEQFGPKNGNTKSGKTVPFST
jgi:hypothetical protein